MSIYDIDTSAVPEIYKQLSEEDKNIVLDLYEMKKDNRSRMFTHKTVERLVKWIFFDDNGSKAKVEDVGYRYNWLRNNWLEKDFLLEYMEESELYNYFTFHSCKPFYKLSDTSSGCVTHVFPVSGRFGTEMKKVRVPVKNIKTC